MKKKWPVIVVSGIVLTILIRFSYSEENETTSPSREKIKGVNFVAPRAEIEASSLKHINNIHANWIAIIPYAYTPLKSNKVIFYKNHPHWWGEGIEGVVSQINMAKKMNLKVMVKPHVWVLEDGWAGNFKCESDEDWKEWEESYRKYILSYASICDSMDVDLFCFSTEYCKAVQLRPMFWNQLIQEIKMLYDGPLTYAANWDNYENVSFWGELDFIGIDAYFPLSDEKLPSKEEINKLWTRYLSDLESFSLSINKSIIFTEYGYRSCDYTTRSPWESMNGAKLNLSAQTVAYESFFESVWNKDWLEGGFVWKWHADHQNAGGQLDSEFTPQNKPSEKVIRDNYSTNY